ncbi:hypothetical protein Tsubulata_010221 [Turnera subulata]|uniref:Uncharacterized protein n=1 Tax=Turnera subulata TaxID=218843 RepID=A0A9Q0GAQ7_9ROSI|nr:hypothetical protein Tsubulata_010221 [Turnera subulata]
MATRGVISKQVFRRFSSGGGKVLSEEEKAAENVYIKVPACVKFGLIIYVMPSFGVGPKPEEKAAPSSGGSATDAKPSSASSAPGASSENVSTDKYRNYAVAGGALTILGALGWYLQSSSKKPEEVRD